MSFSNMFAYGASRLSHGKSAGGGGSRPCAWRMTAAHTGYLWRQTQMLAENCPLMLRRSRASARRTRKEKRWFHRGLLAAKGPPALAPRNVAEENAKDCAIKDIENLTASTEEETFNEHSANIQEASVSISGTDGEVYEATAQCNKEFPETKKRFNKEAGAMSGAWSHVSRTPREAAKTTTNRSRHRRLALKIRKQSSTSTA